MGDTYMLTRTQIWSSAWLVAPFIWILASSALLAVDPMLALGAGLAPIAIYLLVAKSWTRVAVMVGGGMLVLGSTSDVGPVKVVYAAAMIACVLISGTRLLISPPQWARTFIPLVGWGAALLVCLVLGTLATSGQDALTIVRQAMFYTMIPLAPIVGIDAGRDLSSRVVMRWIGILGCVAAAGFAADWLNRRGVSSLSFGRFVVSSPMIAALGFSLALVMIVYVRGWARVLWLSPILIIPAALLVTGTRTNLVVFLALLGVLGPSAKRRVPIHKGLLVALFMIGAAVIVLPIVADYVISQPGFLEARIQALLNVVNGSANDLSYEARNEQYYYAAQWISESPWFGKGPGFNPPISLDTPLATVVRLGIVGTTVLVGFLGSVLLTVRKAGKQYGYSVMHTAATGIAVVAVVMLPFGSPVEDKGFAFMLVLLTMGVAAHIQESVVSAPDPFEVKRRQPPVVSPSPAYARSRLLTSSPRPE